jgi:hypothetical protein
MDDFNSETDSDYTSYWRDWVSCNPFSSSFARRAPIVLEEGSTKILNEEGFTSHRIMLNGHSGANPLCGDEQFHICAQLTSG